MFFDNLTLIFDNRKYISGRHKPKGCRERVCLLSIIPKDTPKRLHNLGTAKTATEDSAVGREEDDVRYARDAIEVGGNLLGIQDLGVGDMEVGDGLQGVLGLVPRRYAQNRETMVLVSLPGLNEVRYFLAA